VLHTIAPQAFIAPEMLHTEGRCPECGTQRLMRDGVVGLLHYRHDNEIKQSLIWVCTPLCILGFENSQFMGKA
jgi:hypothetical protein